MRPFATGLEIKFSGVDVTDLEPAAVPNLYFGAPVRIYGRYRGSGMAQVTLRGSVNGVEVKQASQLEFPKGDAANPEINRLWAWHRINTLLKDADRKGDRSAVVPEIVRLGEDFSIVTEYSSFLVLENDAEYQRWKIARKNLDSIGRDRQVHAKRRDQLDSIRNKALADLGPQAVAPAAGKAPVQMASAAQALNRPAPAPAAQTQSPPQSERRQSWDIPLPGTGSSPVGPLGVLAALWLARRKRKAS
jgi:Ca-activated chloride channel family protein